VALAESGKIDRAQLEAALLWRAWCAAISRRRTQHWVMRADGHPLPGSDLADYQLEAADRLRAAATALGERRVTILSWVIVDDMTWRKIAERLDLSRKTAVSYAVEAIAALALWRSGCPVRPLRLRVLRDVGQTREAVRR
jgi:DNA-directed RNA polymerase specialized sigma24 family protein